MADQNEMDKIVTPMIEHVCDHLCRFPLEIERKEDLEDICAECKMDQYTNLILNTYDRVSDPEKNILHRKAARENMVADWKWHLTERFSRVN